MNNYLIVKDGIIENIIVVTDESLVDELGLLPLYDGAAIGKPYSPPPPIEERVKALEEKSENTASKEDVQAVWDSMAAAYSEGVASA